MSDVVKGNEQHEINEIYKIYKIKEYIFSSIAESLEQRSSSKRWKQMCNMWKGKIHPGTSYTSKKIL